MNEPDLMIIHNPAAKRSLKALEAFFFTSKWIFQQVLSIINFYLEVMLIQLPSRY